MKENEWMSVIVYVNFMGTFLSRGDSAYISELTFALEGASLDDMSWHLLTWSSQIMITERVAFSFFFFYVFVLFVLFVYHLFFYLYEVSKSRCHLTCDVQLFQRIQVKKKCFLLKCFSNKLNIYDHYIN